MGPRDRACALGADKPSRAAANTVSAVVSTPLDARSDFGFDLGFDPGFNTRFDVGFDIGFNWQASGFLSRSNYSLRSCPTWVPRRYFD